MAAALTITEYTDPACPWAFSAEPSRWKLSWMYGDQLDWDVRMVGLSENPEEAVARGFTPEVLSQAFERIGREHKMPIDTGVRERMSASIPACRAVVAARLNAPEQMRALLRSLRIRTFRGELLDAGETIAGAATDAGIDPTELESWMADPATQAALDQDMAAARQPTPAALVQDARLAGWSGGRRYTCPSYELETPTGDHLSAPGFQPFPVYDMATANLLPAIERRAKPESVTELLAWAATPLATQEVAVVCELSLDDAREQLSTVAVEEPVGFDGYWTLAATR